MLNINNELNLETNSLKSGLQKMGFLLLFVHAVRPSNLKGEFMSN